MTALERARTWLANGAKATALVVVPLAAMSTPATAGFVPADDNPTTFVVGSAGFQFSGVASGGSGSVTTAPLPTVNNVTGVTSYGSTTALLPATTPPTTATIDLVLSGTGSGGQFTVSRIPVAWDFTLTEGTLAAASVGIKPAISTLPVDTFTYTVSTTINGGAPSTTGTLDATTVSPNTGSFNAAVPLGAALATWSASVDITWNSVVPGQTLTVNFPQGTSFDINAVTVVPEPASWTMMLMPVLAGAGVFWRRAVKA